ncbi:TIGR01777 family oxidoreductase [Aquibacillus rhizosphaerae]|uniref:TIGR01777 family oxidoreductase n=1 Tax=Aquibacillus rhizosphaerae TaxID=3051431 RepID=A0ABT7L916_9BACI|nr:TIGR01777 family oxidoreductase [Aquibacillus sp. LR5S19]MDL4841864.1 TIGR01777 family oxidoreductase [Aquibacillus sp. LR5S19]
MKIAITGGTGFVGQQLTNALVKQGHKVFILTRSPDKHTETDCVYYIGWLSEVYQPEKSLPKLDAIINLAGDSLFGYWTKTKKERIINSRIRATKNVLNLIDSMDQKPEVLINASAVGFYGTSETESFTEQTTVSGNDFLAEVANVWEDTAKHANEFGVRTVFARLGIVLGKDGALPLMAMPFKLFVGGKVSSGEQWMSWVHIHDVVGIIIHAINNKNIKGPINVTAPSPVRNIEFSKHLAQVLHRPYWLPVPSFAIRTLLGEMSILVLKGQYVKPQKALSNNYTFQFTKIDTALRDIF